MKLHLANTGGNQIRGHFPGRVLVNETVYARSVVVLRDRVIDDLCPAAPGALTAAHFARLAALAPEVVLLGTGERLRFPPAAVTAPLVNAGIGLEVMDTPAACRTFNILAADGRVVAAVLFMTAAGAAQNSESSE